MFYMSDHEEGDGFGTGGGLMTRVLLIDTDPSVTQTLRYTLQEDGFWVDVALDARRGAIAALSVQYAMVVLDVGLPQSDGFVPLRHIRSQSELPVVVLTSRASSSDRIAVLESGADDYVTKPCPPLEMLARIRAVLRRTLGKNAARASRDVLVSGDLSLWPSEGKVERRGASLELTDVEFGVLEILLREVGRPVSKLDLYLQVLGRTPARYERSIDTHLTRLRRKLGNRADGRPLIQPVTVAGYQLLKP